jgi:hypothetical protein
MAALKVKEELTSLGAVRRPRRPGVSLPSVLAPVSYPKNALDEFVNPSVTAETKKVLGWLQENYTWSDTLEAWEPKAPTEQYFGPEPSVDHDQLVKGQTRLRFWFDNPNPILPPNSVVVTFTGHEGDVVFGIDENGQTHNVTYDQIDEVDPLFVDTTFNFIGFWDGYREGQANGVNCNPTGDESRGQIPNDFNRAFIAGFLDARKRKNRDGCIAVLNEAIRNMHRNTLASFQEVYDAVKDAATAFGEGNEFKWTNAITEGGKLVGPVEKLGPIYTQIVNHSVWLDNGILKVKVGGFDRRWHRYHLRQLLVGLGDPGTYSELLTEHPIIFDQREGNCLPSGTCDQYAIEF